MRRGFSPRSRPTSRPQTCSWSAAFRPYSRGSSYRRVAAREPFVTSLLGTQDNLIDDRAVFARLDADSVRAR